MAPSCPIRPSRSISNQCSATLPSTMRSISMLEKATCLSVGGMPWNSPRWVPRKATRAATMSPPGKDVLHREPKVGKSLHEGAGELRPGLQVKGAWEPRGMGDVAWSQDVHFGLRRVGIVERFDPPSNDGPVLVYF